ncbi:hypothetical protein DF3PB_6540001 [uncultured Defluviicoccus sp.]|nr:hypothetical protein DF3PB_6530003 [uncultured Defluviicoccus sp.]SUS08388.1 hypothetical protein DF3PB_6540001 [uncultured Defluviicoccus sp.]
MGVLPLQFKEGCDRKSLHLDGSEVFDITGLAGEVTPRMELTLTIHRATGAREDIKVLSRIDTLDEIEYYKAGGILQYVLRGLAKQA